MNKGQIASLAILAAVASCGMAQADPLYYQGFETDTSGWNPAAGGSIARVPSGGGTLGISAATGGYYGQVGNAPDASGYSGYGDGGYTNLNGNGVTPPPYPGGPFSQSISVYINVSTAAPAATYSPAFWIDMSPSSVTSDGVGCYPAACSDEHNFRLFYTGTSVNVTTDGSTTPALSIVNTGWYTFEITYAQGPTPSSLVENDLDILDASGDLLSSTAALGNSDGATLQSSNLAGPGYIWLADWQDNFSNNTLGIDNVEANVPEPSSLGLVATALAGLAWLGLRQRRRA